MAQYNKKSSEKTREPFDRKALIELIWLDLVQGESRYRILLKLERDAYEGFTTSKLSRASRYNYIREAYQNCKATLEEEQSKQRELFYERILSVYNDAITNSDRANALRALELAVKLSGLATEKQDINLSGNISATISFGIEEEDGDKSEI